MERHAFSWRYDTPEEEAAFRAVEPLVAGFRVEPARVVVRVGERRPLFPLHVVALDEGGHDLQLTSATYDGVEDAAVAAYAPGEGLLGIAPGRTRFALTPGLNTRDGQEARVYVEVEVPSA